MADSYLVLSDFATAQARSQAQATANGCDGVLTKFWWQVGGGPTHSGGYVSPNATSALIRVMSGTPYGTQGLSGAELGQLKLPTALTAGGWTLPP